MIPASFDSEYADVQGMDTAQVLALRIGKSPEAIHASEEQGDLFSVGVPGRPERLYPRYQMHPCLAGAPLRSLLAQLRGPDGSVLGGAAAHMFFCTSIHELAYLTPLQLAAGVATHESPMSDMLSSQPPEERLRILLAAARTYADAANV